MKLQQDSVAAATAEPVTGASKSAFVRWLPWIIWIASLLLLSLALLLPFITNPDSFTANLFVNVVGTPALLAYATVGALISARRPENPIGWIFSGTALLVILGVASEEYARFALQAAPGSLPGGLVFAWFSSWVQNVGFFMMFTFLLLLFPDGHLPTPRWRIMAWIAALAIAIVAIFDAFQKGPVTPTLDIDNPLGVDFITELALNFGDLIILVTIVVCLSSVIIRFRRSTGDEHQQLKWFAYAAAIGLAQFALRFVLGSSMDDPDMDALFDVLLLFTIAAFPVAAGIAILKYRLYDIDLLVNRTLVYVPLTAILAGVYSASIAFFQKLFVAATGEQSDAAVVITTLILVSSFTPIKNALQSAVDRRFKEVPDPAKKLRAFGAEVNSFVQISSPALLTQRLLDETTLAFNATGGAVYAGEPDRHLIVRTAGGWNEDADISVSPSDHCDNIESVSLGKRRNGLEYSPRDRQALQEIVDVVAGALDRGNPGN